MEKKDLKAGMMVELSDGFRYVLIPNSYGLQLVDVANATIWKSSLHYFNDDLTASDKFIKNIVKVYGLSDTSPFYFINRKLLWERDFKIKLTTEEIEILKALKVLGMNYLIRDIKDNICAYKTTLTSRREKNVFYEGDNFVVFDDYFNYFKYFKFVGEERTMYQIDELLKGVK
jgi:hypothetical protein